MQPINQTWQDILALLQVPTHPNMFVLGSFAARVTVYSQQVRALNLIDALVSTGRIRRRSSVAIVGAGAAGLTAASALLRMGVLNVRIFESEDGVLPIQRSSRARYLHPHIYDWPARDIAEVRAELPVLDWEACYANELAAKFASAWRGLCKSRGVTSELHKAARVTSKNLECRVSSDGAEPELFDITIVAVGFGVERDSRSSYPYWADIPADDPRFRKRTWLISGAGDGALTDVMRLGFNGSNHDEILRLVVRNADNQPDALKRLKSMVRAGMTGPALFEAFNPNQLIGDASLRDGEVLLNTNEAQLFGTNEVPARSSVLNRLITWALLKKGKVKLLDGRLSVDDIPLAADGWHVPLVVDGVTKIVQADEVLVRHGPEAPFTRELRGPLPWLDGDTSFWRSLRVLRSRWQRLYGDGHPDRTLDREHWSPENFTPEQLSLEFGPGQALLLSSDRVARGLANSVAAAVRATNSSPEQSDAELVQHLVVDAALKDARTFGQAIRALHDAPVAIVDITQQDVGLMLLLGIRAVSRRGITVAIVCGNMDTVRWDDLAFNLRGLRIVADPEPARRDFELKLVACLRTGVYRCSQRSDYLDLPVFDVVRNIGIRPDDYAPLRPEVLTVVLCPFDERYSSDLWPELQRAIESVHARSSRNDGGPARRAIDLESPEVLERRLYEAIRRCDACIVDLTLDRANVYFELGVRLATNNTGATIVRAAPAYASEIWPQGTPTTSQSSVSLDELLGTISYTAKSLENALQTKNTGKTSGSFVFDTLRDVTAAELELAGRSVEETLQSLAASAVGPDPIKDAMSPLLYGDNPSVATSARRLALEAKLALALYWVHRQARQRPDAVERATKLLTELSLFEENVELPANEREQVRRVMQTLREELKDHELNQHPKGRE